RLAHRAEIDGNDKLLKFSTDLEQACIDSVDIHCKMTKDLALSIHRKKWQHAKAVQGWIKENRIKILEDWPSQSPILPHRTSLQELEIRLTNNKCQN
ncbi:2665_t:CDS:2, partial [Entrophospora sp. SA101]